MDILTKTDVASALAEIGNTAARDALVSAMREAGVESGAGARFTAEELAEFGITRGKRYILKGSKSSPIAAVRTEQNGCVLVILN